LRAILALVATVILLAASGAGGLLWIRHSHMVRRDARVTAELVRHLNPGNITGAAGPADLPEADRADMVEIALFMDNLRLAMHARDKKTISQQVDVLRLLQSIANHKFIRATSDATNGHSIDALADDVGDEFSKSGSLTWDRHEITRIRFLTRDQVEQSGGDASAREAVISLRAWPADGHEMSMRWWLRGTGQNWKWYDYEYLDGTRYGLAHGVFIGRTVADPCPWTSRLDKWDVLVGAYLKGKWDKVEEAGAALAKLDPDNRFKDGVNSPGQVDSPGFPPMLEANVLRIRGEKCSIDGDTGGAIRVLDAAESLFPDLPAIYIVRARARYAAGQYQQALADINRYRDDFATNGLFHRTAGFSLLGLGRTSEALTEFRKALDEFPNDIDSFVGLSRALPKGDKSELVDRFAAARKPDDVFYGLPPRLDDENDVASLDALAAAQHVRRPDDIWADFYMARALMIQESWLKAADLLQPILPKAPNEQAARNFINDYLTALVSAGDPVRAYRNLPDRGEAFKQVAQRLMWPKTVENAASLRKLVAARATDVPSDPWVDFYTGVADEMDGRLDAADASYTRGLLKQLTPETAERFRSARVAERCQAGRWMTAFEADNRNDSFRDKTFRQIAYYLQSRRQIDDLDRLASLYRQRWPDSPLSPMWQAEILYQRHQYGPAGELLTEERRTILSEPDQESSFSDRLIRCLVQKRRLDDAMTEALASAAREAANAATSKPGDANSTAAAVPATPRPDPVYVLMISAARGDVAGATAAFENCLDDDTDPSELYADPEIGPFLQAPAFRMLRQKYPQAVTQPSSSGN
jgi:tetratricopeptide (TPR) repeat protein